ncbi:hypothetical protein CsSME_00018575 [Camellia sinensis var. sinensis]
MEVLAVVHGDLVECARIGQTEIAAELSTVKVELEATRRKVVSLEFELASEQKKADKAQRACATTKERLEKALVNNEELHDQASKDKEEADMRVAELERALREEKAKTAELNMMMVPERVVYPDLCTTAVEQFKLSLEFQMAINTAVARALAREGGGGAGPSRVAAAELVE